MSKLLGEEQQQAIEFLRVLETGHDEQAIVGKVNLDQCVNYSLTYMTSPPYPNASLTVWNSSPPVFETVSSSAAREVDVHSGALDAWPKGAGPSDVRGSGGGAPMGRRVESLDQQQLLNHDRLQQPVEQMLPASKNLYRRAPPSGLLLQKQLNAMAMPARIAGFPIGGGAIPSNVCGSGVGAPIGGRVESSGHQRLLDDRLQQPVERTPPASINPFTRVTPAALLQQKQLNAMAMGDMIPGFPIGGGAGPSYVRRSGVGVSMGALAGGSSATRMLGNVIGGFGLLDNMGANMEGPTPDSMIAQGLPAQPSPFSSGSPLLVRSLSASAAPQSLVLRKHRQTESKRRSSQVLNAELETPSQHVNKCARTNALISSTNYVDAQITAGNLEALSVFCDSAYSEAEERSWEGIPAERYEPAERASIKNKPEGIFVPWIKFKTVAEEKECYYRQRSVTATAYGGFSDIFQCDAQLPDGTQALVAVKRLRAVKISRTLSAYDVDAKLQRASHCSLYTGFYRPIEFTKKIYQRFNREVKIWAALQHPNIAPLLGFNLSGEVSIISPWYINGNVAAHLENNPNLDKLDLDNILVDIDGTPKLIDFGLSKVVEDAQGVATLTSASLRDAGNARWIAPELLLEEGISRSCNTDTFSFGCVAFFIFTGDIPFKDISDRTLTLARSQGAQPMSNDAHYPDLKTDTGFKIFVALDDEFHALFATGNRRKVYNLKPGQ
ncbi:hypothetical protein FRC00_005855 [Tulasnella sp. 408]|nr:hypothetical protein FRC00_005855 [Tulasnella sp. 408]